jgi:plastocyanin
MRVKGGLVALGLLSGCNAAVGPSPPPSGYLITIQNYTFTPQHLSLPPGAAVIVLNLDPFQHSVVSSTAEGSYIPGSVNGIAFNTGPFMNDAAISIPADAKVGTVVPYFCQIHEGAMLDQPDITIVAPDAGTP